ncbi:MAG TPA: hypothetical protein VH969_20765 [Actinophytocola sp.]|jgi:hypothetical protein|uniref:hypothetical protein n=1 Tax=Actinophytocola sp. TaxID=1872138 RepID=UPI002F93C5D4
MPINVTEVLQEFIRNLLTDRTFAAQYAQDPHGMLAAQGVTDHDLSAVDMQSAVQRACADPSVSQETRSAVQGGYSGGGGPSGHSGGGIDQVVQHLNYVTYQTYEGDEYITNLVDNSVDITGNVFGDVDINNATGDGSQIIDGDNFGQANTGDGAVLAGDDASGVNTGVNTGINAGGDVEDSVVGDDNQTANVDGSADGSVLHFGDGDVNNTSNNDIEDSTVGTGSGDVTDVDVEDNDTTVTDSHDTVTAVQDNDTTVIEDNDTVEDNDISVVEDNDTVESGDDAVAAQ